MSVHEIRGEVNPAWAAAISETTPIIVRLLTVLREVLDYARAPATALEALARTDGQRYELDALSDLVFEIHQLSDWDHGVLEVDGDWYAAWTGDAAAIARITARADAAVGGIRPATQHSPDVDGNTSSG
jgi:hypothetical protein